jgi:hypothetical protein
MAARAASSSGFASICPSDRRDIGFHLVDPSHLYAKHEALVLFDAAVQSEREVGGLLAHAHRVPTSSGARALVRPAADAQYEEQDQRRGRAV